VIYCDRLRTALPTKFLCERSPRLGGNKKSGYRKVIKVEHQ
jgi:hypothetical protein